MKLCVRSSGPANGSMRNKRSWPSWQVPRGAIFVGSLAGVQNGPKSLVFPWRMLGLKMLKNVEPIIRWNWVWVKLLGQHCEPVKWGGHQQIWLNLTQMWVPKELKHHVDRIPNFQAIARHMAWARGGVGGPEWLGFQLLPGFIQLQSCAAAWGTTNHRAVLSWSGG